MTVNNLCKKILLPLITIILIIAMSVTNPVAYGANSNIIARVTNVKIIKKSNKVTIKWKKVRKAKGYQIKISTNKKLKKSDTRTFNKQSSKLNIRLDDNKTYYIKVRAYQKINGTKKFGKWSKLKSFTMNDKAKGYWCDDGGTHHSCNDNTIGWYNTAVKAEDVAKEYILKNGKYGTGNYLLEQCDFCGKWTAVIKIDVYK